MAISRSWLSLGTHPSLTWVFHPLKPCSLISHPLVSGKTILNPNQTHKKKYQQETPGFQGLLPWLFQMPFPSLRCFTAAEARIPDRLRAAAAADAAEAADARLAPLAQQLLRSCAAALPADDAALPVGRLEGVFGGGVFQEQVL